MSQPEQNRFEEKSFKEQATIVQALALYPALTIMIFLRRKMGFRLLKPTWLLVLALIMATAAFIAPDATTSPHGWALLLFAVAMLGFGMVQRQLRWRELNTGARWHTYCPGISWLEALPMPGFLLAQRRIYRFLDPAVCLLLGVAVTFLLSHALGMWIAISALALYIYEQAIYEKQLERELDTLDGLLAAELQKDTAEHFAGPQPSEKQRTLEETGGIPTGVASDIQKHIELRKAKLAKAAALDNLA